MGNFPRHNSYGFIELDSFSGYGVGEEGAEDREYSASSYYSEEHKNHKIHFTIFWNTKVHNKVCILCSLLDMGLLLSCDNTNNIFF